MSADILRDLARAKAAFQLRAIEAVIRGTAIATEAATAAETVKLGSVHEGAGRRHRPNPAATSIGE